MRTNKIIINKSKSSFFYVSIFTPCRTKCQAYGQKLKLDKIKEWKIASLFSLLRESDPGLLALVRRATDCATRACLDMTITAYPVDVEQQSNTLCMVKLIAS